MSDDKRELAMPMRPCPFDSAVVCKLNECRDCEEHAAYIQGRPPIVGESVNLTSDDKREPSTEVMEKLAKIEHERWAGQARTALYEMTTERRERWSKLIEIPYEALDEKNKELDRMQIREWWSIVQDYIDSAIRQAVEEEREKWELINKNRWINVEDRLPTDEERGAHYQVIVFRPYSKYPVQIETLHPGFWKEEGKVTDLPITHWMAMPFQPDSAQQREKRENDDR